MGPAGRRGSKLGFVALGPEDIVSQEFPVKVWGYDKEKVDAFLQQISNEYREIVRSRNTVSPPPPPRSSFEELGERVTSILENASQGADEMKLAAEREAQAIRAAAAEEAAETVEAALDQLEAANQAKANAESEAEAIRAAARYEAGRMEQEAIERAAKLEQDAREKAANLERAANANVAAVLSEARRRYEHLRQAEQKLLDRLSAVEALVSKAREELPQDEIDPAADYAGELHMTGLLTSASETPKAEPEGDVRGYAGTNAASARTTAGERAGRGRRR